MLIQRENNMFVLDFAYNPRIIEAIKSNLPVKFFDWKRKVWTVPVHQEDRLRKFARIWGFTFSEPETGPVQDFTINKLPDLDIDIPLKRPLYEFQRSGVAYAIKKKRCLIGDKPGLGKTGQAIAAVMALNAFPCLVITPPDPLKENWEVEWGLWTNKRARIITPAVIRHLNTWVEKDLIQVFIVNYESLKKYFVEKIEKPPSGKFTLKNVTFNSRIDIFKSVIIDESHKCANHTTLRTKLCKGIVKKKEIIYCLTGTPVLNKPKDLMPQLSILGRLDDLGGYKYFTERYCAGMKEASNLQELNYKLNEICFYSRNKEDVMPDLPPKQRQVVMCDIDAEHRLEYNEALADLETYLVKYKEADDEKVARAMRGEVMVRIGILKNISARGKLGSVKQFVTDTLENEKLVVFLHQHEVFHAMKKAFPQALSITGLDANDQRVENKAQFQNDPSKKLILCSMAVAGEGITLHASSHVSFIELPWHSAKTDQCEDRCHRIGQKDSVLCTYFLGRDTIDEWIYKLIQDKRAMVDAITGGNSDIVEVSIVDDIINLFSKQKEVVEV